MTTLIIVIILIFLVNEDFLEYSPNSRDDFKLANENVSDYTLQPDGITTRSSSSLSWLLRLHNGPFGVVVV
jgi:hypothetical protein